MPLIRVVKVLKIINVLLTIINSRRKSILSLTSHWQIYSQEFVSELKGSCHYWLTPKLIFISAKLLQIIPTCMGSYKTQWNHLNFKNFADIRMALMCFIRSFKLSQNHLFNFFITNELFHLKKYRTFALHLFVSFHLLVTNLFICVMFNNFFYCRIGDRIDPLIFIACNSHNIIANSYFRFV